MSEKTDNVISVCSKIIEDLGFLSANVPNHISFGSAKHYAESQGAEEDDAIAFAWSYVCHRMMIGVGADIKKMSLRDAWTMFNKPVVID